MRATQVCPLGLGSAEATNNSPCCETCQPGGQAMRTDPVQPCKETMSGSVSAMSLSSAALLLHLPLRLQVSTRIDESLAPASRPQGRQKPMIGQTATAAAAASGKSRRRRKTAAAGTKITSGKPQTHRGPKSITVASHQRSPPKKISIQTASNDAR